jgi:homoserine dehydrogenase
MDNIAVTGIEPSPPRRLRFCRQFDSVIRLVGMAAHDGNGVFTVRADVGQKGQCAGTSAE